MRVASGGREWTPWRIIRARYEEPFVTGLASVVLAGAVVLPLALVVIETRVDTAESHLLLRAVGYLGVIADLLARSVVLAATVTAGAFVIGLPLGVVLAKSHVRTGRLALVLHAFPMFLPPLLLALGWFYLFGQQGVLGSRLTSAVLFSAPGAIAVLVLAFAPVVTCLTMLGLRSIDPALEEAARLVARPLRVVTRIVLPAVWPAETLAALIVFTLAFSELGVPMFLGVRVYPAAIFSRLGGASYAPGEAVLLVLPLVGVALGLLALERTFLGRRSFAVLGLRSREDALRIPLGRGAGPVMIAMWSVATLSVLPLVGLLVTAARGGLALVPRWIGHALENSFSGAILAALIITVLGVVLGRAVARDRPGARMVDAVGVLAFLTPAPVLGIGLIALWNRPTTRLVYGSVAIVVLGYVARYAVIGIRTIASSIAQTPPSLEEAAAVSGAPFLMRLRRIVIPVSSRGLATGALLALVFCLRDLETAVLYYPPGGETLPVRILTLEANGPEPVVAALALVHVLATGVVVAAGGALLLGARRR